jgi:CPA1 family monovalent cation:H+ antiporter
MNLFQVAALFLTIVAAVGWINTRVLRLPPSVAMLGAGLLAAGLLHGLRLALPGAAGVQAAVRVVSSVDFPQTVVGYMLAFLLFAGAMQVDLGELRRRRLAVWTLATGGVAASTALVGGGIWMAARGLGVDLPLIWALVFGALISPTDPVAVLSTVRGERLSGRLKAVIQGEALFNDGVGIVVFLALLAVATGRSADPGGAALKVIVMAGGGLLFGAVAGLVAVRATKAIDDYAVEVLDTLTLAAGIYAAAQALGL